MKTPRLLLLLIGGLLNCLDAQDGVLIDELSVDSDIPLGSFAYPDTLFGYFGNPLSQETISGFFQLDLLEDGEVQFTELAGLNEAAELIFVSESDGANTRIWVRVFDPGLEGLPLWVAVSLESGNAAITFTGSPGSSSKVHQPLENRITYSSEAFSSGGSTPLFEYLPVGGECASSSEGGDLTVSPQDTIVSDQGKTVITWLDPMEVLFERLVQIEGRKKMERLRKKYENRPAGVTLLK